MQQRCCKSERRRRDVTRQQGALRPWTLMALSYVHLAQPLGSSPPPRHSSIYSDGESTKERISTKRRGGESQGHTSVKKTPPHTPAFLRNVCQTAEQSTETEREEGKKVVQVHTKPPELCLQSWRASRVRDDSRRRSEGGRGSKRPSLPRLTYA